MSAMVLTDEQLDELVRVMRGTMLSLSYGLSLVGARSHVVVDRLSDESVDTLCRSRLFLCDGCGFWCAMAEMGEATSCCRECEDAAAAS